MCKALGFRVHIGCRDCSNNLFFIRLTDRRLYYPIYVSLRKYGITFYERSCRILYIDSRTPQHTIVPRQKGMSVVTRLAQSILVTMGRLHTHILSAPCNARS